MEAVPRSSQQPVSLAPPSSAASSSTSAPTTSALFREIHKNAWLKRLPAEDGLKILSVSQKRSTERWWMVFCVHGDTEPFLEAYDDGSAANTHAPRWRTPLSRAHHISGSIRHTGRGEYEFVVATQDGALRLVAPTREAMQDWVDTLRNKLREMKILAPQENVYSKAPEQLKPRAPTRDPTSPLPPPPPGPTVRVPGTEPLRLIAAVNETSSLPDVTVVTTQINAITNTQSNPIYVEEPNNAETEANNASSSNTNNQQTPSPGTSVDLSEEFFNVRSHIKAKAAEQKTDGVSNSIISSENAWENFEDMDTALSEDVNISIPSTSKTAKISGMNVCLVDSILDRRLDTDSDDEFFAEFDAACKRSEDQSTSHRRTEITDETINENLTDSKKKEIRLKYSQVDLKAKSSHRKFEQFKKNLLDSAAEKKDNKDRKTLKIEGNLSSNITVEEPTSKSPLNNNTEVNHTNPVDVKVIQAKPIAAIRKKVLLDRTNSVPDATGKETYLENFSAELVQDAPGSSNITIINVSNDHPQRKSEQEVLKPIKPAKYLNSYVNVEMRKDNKETSIKIEEISQVNVGSGYGHIRHHSSDKKDSNISLTPVIFIKPPPGSKPRRKSESGVSTIQVEDDINTRVNSEGFYDSVFTPVTVSKNPDSKENQVVVKISDSSKLVVRSSSPKLNNSNILDTPILQVPSSSSSGRSVVEITSASQSTDLSNRDITGNYELLSLTQNSELRNRNTPPNTRMQESALEALINTSNTENINDNSRNVTRTNFRPGLFTRGLTELSIVSKFRNLSSNNGRQQLVKNNQFYSDNEDNNQVLNLPVSSSSSKKPGKLSIFNKLSESKKDGVGALKSRIEAVQRVESSLRRNWSEHNDRTAPIAIVRNSREPTPPITRNVPENNSRSLNEEIQTRRRSSSLSSTRTNTEDSNAESTSPPVSSSAANNSNTNHDSAPPQRPLTLREQQVCRLRAEMRHAGGVRLRMRSRDCPGEAMALVDAYGAVWIAGWKQKSHPLLYNALHIGDRLAAVGGTPVTTSRQAKKLLRDTSGVQFIELIIKRLPHARVFALRKDSDTQELGLIMDLATIAGVVPNTPAARGGIPSAGTLTEINGRPLNLLLKKDDSQVRDRLNAIGKDISLLIQPTEFVQLLRTGLKSIRSHKDYIIQ